jgi:hypothetical protein
MSDKDDQKTEAPNANDPAPEGDAPATALETQAQQALEAAATKGMSKEERQAARVTAANAQKEEAGVPAQTAEDSEIHLVEDLMNASAPMFGVPPEVVAGAAHAAGLEMTSEVTQADMAGHINAFMAQPA